ncbi:MAG: hypothetical protein L6R38_000291 [Xanthoria sp. 2 TBL-2021]|nr:MAG: hypothetical protein L6R38_000291 [Xanthoria sp. 2 TBL-2021]
MTASNTAGSQTMGSTTSPGAAATTAGEAGSSSGAGIQHVAPGLCGVAAIFGLALLHRYLQSADEESKTK